MWRLLLVFGALGFVVPAIASADSCPALEDPRPELLPSEGAAGIPTNVQFWSPSDFSVRRRLDWAEVPLEDVGDVIHTAGTTSRWRPVEPLEPNGHYAVVFSALAPPRAVSYIPFSTGEGPDVTPPAAPRVWIEPRFASTSACGAGSVLKVDSNGALMALVSVGGTAPLDGRETYDLFPPPSRRYGGGVSPPDFDARVVAIDLAGNVSEPSGVIRIDTDGGCASTGASVAALAALLWRRRRSQPPGTIQVFGAATSSHRTSGS